MVPPEEACGHEVGHHHVDGVVIMSQQDAEDTDGTQAPADPVIPPEPPWRICKKNTICIIVSKCRQTYRTQILSMVLSVFVHCITCFNV